MGVPVPSLRAQDCARDVGNLASVPQTMAGAVPGGEAHHVGP